MLKKFLMLAVLTVCWTHCASANDFLNIDDKGLALKGYDVVAYFEKNKAMKGFEKFEHQWNGGRWRFANKNNLDIFMANPQKYMPQYGGFCAFAMFFGQKADIDPKSFTVFEGKLYLNASSKVMKNWEDNKDQYIFQADQKWALLRNQR